MPTQQPQGAMATLAQWYDRHAPSLYRCALTLTGSRPDAEDLVQEVFTAVASGSLSGVRDERAYLFAALRHAATRWSRRRQRERAAMHDQPLCLVSPLAREMDEPLEWALQSLPDEQRLVVSMKIDGQLTFAQIGQVLGVSINTAASRYRYALEKLRAMLEQDR